MPQKLTTYLREQDQADLTVSITKSGTSDVPTALSYTLTDKDGTVINSVSGVALTPAASMTLTLKGDDLQIVDRTNKYEKRYLVFDGTDSDGDDISESLELMVARVGA